LFEYQALLNLDRERDDRDDEITLSGLLLLQKARGRAIRSAWRRRRSSAQQSRDDRDLALNGKALRIVDARLIMSDTPVGVQFTSAGCLNYPCRTPPLNGWSLGQG